MPLLPLAGLWRNKTTDSVVLFLETRGRWWWSG
jgi:hypothetical protein